MTEKETKDVWVRVKDDAGNEFICPLNALKDRQSATEEELDALETEVEREVAAAADQATQSRRVCRRRFMTTLR